MRCTNNAYLLGGRDNDANRGPGPGVCVEVCPAGYTAVGSSRDGRECERLREWAGTLVISNGILDVLGGHTLYSDRYLEDLNCELQCELVYAGISVIRGGLSIFGNDGISTLGTSFQILRSANYLTITGNTNLASFGTAFRSLTRIANGIAIRNNHAELTDFENFRNLGCHGGVHSNSQYPDTDYCEGCPSWLINLPRC